MTAPRPRALFLVHRLPFPPDKGDKIRSWHLLKFLSERYDVALGTYIDDPADKEHIPVVAERCAEFCMRELSPIAGKARAARGLLVGEPLSFAWYRDRAMSAFVDRQREAGLDLEVYFSGAMTRFLPGAHAPVIVDLVDADSEKWKSYAETGNPVSRWVHRREAKKVAAAERRAIAASRRTFLVTPEEVQLLEKGAERGRVDHFRNGIDLDYWSRMAAFERVSPVYDVVFTGAMDYRPNAEGAVWFVENVWPLLRNRHPDLTFGVVGRHPRPEVKALHGPDGVAVTGKVRDVRPYLSGAKVAVAPLSIARGVQNKVLEAMAMSVPMVATGPALTGIEATSGEHVVRADEPEVIAAEISALLDEPRRAEQIGRAGRTLVETRYTWEQTLARFATALPDGH